MEKRFGYAKVVLEQALQLAFELEPAGSEELAAAIASRFTCSRRAAQDAFHVLREPRYLERVRPGEAAADGRRRFYRVSERGHYVLSHPNGPLLLRFARQYFTTCPSKHARRVQADAIAQHGDLHRAYAEKERELLVDPSKLRRRATGEEFLAKALASRDPFAWMAWALVEVNQAREAPPGSAAPP